MNPKVIEKLVKITTYKIYKYCAKCGTELISTNKTLLVHPPKYMHKCPECEDHYSFDRVYPYIDHRESDD